MLRSTTRPHALALLAVLSLAPLAHAQDAEPTLKPGDPAPPIAVGAWLKGDPVTDFKPGTVYVMEFWATWCGPCIASIPELTAIQKKYEGKVVVIAVNVFEPDTSVVAPFVKKQGDAMGYRVATDDTRRIDGGAMAAFWMAAAGANGIPTSMVVDAAGKIAWIGHPMRLGKVLDAVVAGNFDPKAFEEKENQALEQKRADYSRDLMAATAGNDAPAAMKAIDAMAAADPEFAAQAALVRYKALLSLAKFDDAAKLRDDVFTLLRQDAPALEDLAWQLTIDDATKPHELPFAIRLAERAVELDARKHPRPLATLAALYFDAGDHPKAIALQTEAISLAPPQDKPPLTDTLHRYQAAK